MPLEVGKEVSMNSSILTSIKKLLGIEAEYEHFDTDIKININTILMFLTQLGIGPEEGYFITGPDETWDVFLGHRLGQLEAIKTYVYLKVRIIFDPPANSFLIEAMERQIKEIEWRLNVEAERGAKIIG